MARHANAGAADRSAAVAFVSSDNTVKNSVPIGNGQGVAPPSLDEAHRWRDSLRAVLSSVEGRP
jgi:hypothetical protein